MSRFKLSQDWSKHKKGDVVDVPDHMDTLIIYNGYGRKMESPDYENKAEKQPKKNK